MSFISEALNKLSSGNKNKHGLMPPGMGKKPDGNNKFRNVLIGIIIVLVVVGSIGIFMSDKIIAMLSPSKPAVQYAKTDTTPVIVPKIVEEPVLEHKVAIIPETFATKAIEEKPVQKIESPKKADDKLFMVNSLIANAQRAAASEDYKNALKHYEDAYQIKKDPLFEYNIAALQIQTRQPDKAVNTIVASSMDDDDVRDLLQDMIEHGYYEEAESAIEQLIQKQKSPGTYYIAGYLKEVQGNMAAAVNDYKKAMIMSDYDPYLTYAYSRGQDILGNYNNAALHYAMVLENVEDANLKNTVLKRIEELSRKTDKK